MKTDFFSSLPLVPLESYSLPKCLGIGSGREIKETTSRPLKTQLRHHGLQPSVLKKRTGKRVLWWSLGGLSSILLPSLQTRKLGFQTTGRIYVCCFGRRGNF